MEMKTSMDEVFKALKKAGYDVSAPISTLETESLFDEGATCPYHDGKRGHDLENC
ncbi:hypothetical protein SESBI_11538 [Sesbania bispinosa]|nr:hypothetical protein SESBI_11538 [Sesbania bispinosa]